ncbi:hypothetical protein [Komagataeibacter europaeus]|nr:hypothetical protein [Komagataeibacter europaeus]
MRITGQIARPALFEANLEKIGAMGLDILNPGVGRANDDMPQRPG